ncbi:hypothetical protein A5886_000373 [Enterococcus sp. 8G7_MSG3316]|uniref:Uncharacterized protein n=1 Tax=Candidatus Enterococcus testudinis TaxID=1834191 RepID=A0A242A3X0_9ENTE|nr:hypothetical protein [Enterococcus sp. 8G7_MSG3316]OTN75303.1 hypothetical protein A5886_000373 [Enterococcus sp. 8G7_MSG3316]
MYKPLFTNIVMISQKKEQVVAFLENPKNIIKWDSEVALVEEDQNVVNISRVHEALNNKESISIESNDERIIYNIKGDRLDYQVMFELEEENGLLEISETVLLPVKANRNLPIKLLKPVAKHAFANKLENLAAVVEQL